MLLSRTLGIPRTLQSLPIGLFRQVPALQSGLNRLYVSKAKDDNTASIDKRTNTIKYKAQTWDESSPVQYNSVDKAVWHVRPINRPTTNGRMVVRIPLNALNKRAW